MTPDPRDPRDPLDPLDPLMNSQPMLPFEAVLKKSLGRRYRVMFFDFFMTASLERLLLRPFLNEVLPKMLSKSMIPHEMSLKKSKKRQAIARVAVEVWVSSGRGVEHRTNPVSL